MKGLVTIKSVGFIFVLSLFLLNSVYAQQITVRGTVTSAADGEPLPGVNIIIQGTTIGTATSAQGNYRIIVPSATDTLVFSFIGFATQQVPVQGRSTIDVAMQYDTFAGEEVVVIGYGTQRQRDLTGSISRVRAEEITEQPALTAMEALQGKIPGVNVINSDAPGGTPSVVLRGLGTALGGRTPLYVVDGIPVENINNISPSDIESIDVLKDASAASIYGLRAANGVIIVTTKEGQRGAPQFEVSSRAGYTSILNQVQMANARQYVEYFNEEMEMADDPNKYFLDPEQQYNTDWYDELLQIGHTVDSKVSVSGGREGINYFLSYNLMEEKGILNEQKFWRQTLRNNNNYKLFDDFLTIDQNLSVSITRENPKPFNAFNTAYRQSPLIPKFYANGRYGQPFVNETSGKATYKGQQIARLNSHGNPLVGVNFNNQKRNTLTLQGGVAANFNFTDYLTLTSRLGATKWSLDARNFGPRKQIWFANDPTRTMEEFETNKAANPEATNWADNSLFVENTETFRWNWDNFLAFQKTFGKHDVKATLGMSSEEFRIGSHFEGKAYDVPEQEHYWNLNLASDNYTKEVKHTNFTYNSLLSYFGRVQYNYDQRYYITGTLRRDGSSKFANTEDYWEYFPSAGLGWTISNEDFMEDSEFIDFLKLRVSWGKLGNQSVPFNTTVIQTNTASGSQNYVFGPGQTLRFGASVGSPARDISWEIVEEWNVGLDLETLGGRFSTTLDVYRKTTENVILQVTPTPSSQYAGKFFDHGGEVVNEGVEVGLGWNDSISENFSYNVGVNFSYNDNEVIRVRPGYEGLTGGSLGLAGQITKRLAEGQPLGAWWLYEVDGVWQNQDEIDNNPSIGGAKPGHLRYKDRNEDGIIDERDKRYFGSYIPTYNFGINIGLNYKQFDFSVDGFGVGGNKVYNGLNNTRIGGENTTKEMFDNRWTGNGSTNSHPGAHRALIASDYYLENGSYFRINNITLGYTLPDIVDHVSRLRLYVSTQNPFLFTDYSGFTPELIGNNNGDPYGTAGIELSAYPNTRNLLFGINIDLQ